LSSFKSKLIAGLILLLAVAAPPSVWAASSAWDGGEFSKVRLVSAIDGTGSGSVPMGLHFELTKDWKIYWRSPGDAGYPPNLDWSAAKNLKDAKMDWPAPERFSVLGLETMGYKHEVVYPLTVTVADPQQPLEANLAIDYLACSEICVPVQANVALKIEPGAGGPSAEAQLINKYASKVPKVQTSGDPVLGLSLIKAALKPAAEGEKRATLFLEAAADTGFAKPDVFVEGPEDAIFLPPKITPSQDGKTLTVSVPADLQFFKKPLVGEAVTVTLIDGGRGIERTLKVAKADPTMSVPAEIPAVPTSENGFGTILLLAVLGGLILNLMPCVLPVLSIKLLGVVKHGGGDGRQVRLSFIASALGIVSSFLVLAGALIVLKNAGMSVGWGIQFQQSWFLIAMTLMVTFFAANLWGFFEIGLPRWVADMGEHSSHVHGLGGHFLTGVLATLLSTPCSAPFLGTAVGFALSRGPVDILAVFAALGIGLAIPYLLVALVPSLATRLPKPGPWMGVLKKVLGFALAATGIWLLTVLETQMGYDGATGVAVSMLILLAALYGRAKVGPVRKRLITGFAIAVSVAAFVLPAQFLPPPKETKAYDAASYWVPFDPAAIGRHVAEGKTVFVDVTADWCITCKVNKRVALGNDEVSGLLSGNSIIAMQADWTKPSDEIAAYLASFGRYGIPFNAVYSPVNPKGVALPELLTPGLVKDALTNGAKG